MDNIYPPEVDTPTPDAIAAEWDMLLSALRRHSLVLASCSPSRALAEVWVELRCADEDLDVIDRTFMSCPVIDPLYRKRISDRIYRFVAVKRSGWRSSVPFLLDPDGDRHHYRYEAIATDQRPC